jgi:hypothetical protein
MKECPFWVEHALCSADGPGECGICECDENEIPRVWNDVSPTQKESITNWQERDEDVWIIQDDTEDTMYVNLQTNPERYTGFGGGTSNNIWLMIYKENCFPDPYECAEQRVFYRLISGLHASTTAHICEIFHHPDGTWGPNLDMFIYRLGGFPDRMKNIYFTFVYLLRAAQKASKFLSSYDYDTAHPEEDQRVQSLMKTLLSSSLVCSSTFDETTLFQGERASLKGEFMAKFRNISEIMDCVSCQTCKVHAKLQILGIATATKILITDDPKIMHGLQHNEISALINTLFKFSESIQIIHNMKEREEKYLKDKREAEEETGEKAGSNEGEKVEGKKEEQGHPAHNHNHTSIYVLVVVGVLITVAALFTRSNTKHHKPHHHSPKPQPNTKKPPQTKNGADESTNEDGAESKGEREEKGKGNNLHARKKT